MPAQHFNYSDINALESIKLDAEKGLQAAAQQFESLFMDIVLKSMRSANKVFSEGNYLSSSETELHQEMLDHQWAIHLAENGGIGLSGVIVDQLRGRESAGESLRKPETNSQTQVSAASRPQTGPESDNRAPEAVHSKNPPFNVSSSGTKSPAFESAGDFLKQLLPVFEQTLKQTPFNPMVLAAQSALETGWGQKLIHQADGGNSHNLFGIKAGENWQGNSVAVKTVEYVLNKPVTQQDRFRAYDSFEESIQDYVSFLSDQPRYQKAVQAVENPLDYLEALQQAGYATDPGYAEKIHRILDDPSFTSQVKAVLELAGDVL